jgi:hypothetical protein
MLFTIRRRSQVSLFLARVGRTLHERVRIHHRVPEAAQTRHRKLAHRRLKDSFRNRARLYIRPSEGDDRGTHQQLGRLAVLPPIHPRRISHGLTSHQQECRVMHSARRN